MNSISMLMNGNHHDCSDLIHILCRGDIEDLEGFFEVHGSSERVKSQLNKLDETEGLSPLHLAIRFGYVESCKLLIKYGADIELKDQEGKCPIHYCTKYFKTSKLGKQNTFSGNNGNHCMEILLSHNVDVNTTDKFGNTGLHYACYKGHTKAVEILLTNSSVNIEAQNDHGFTPFHEAVRHGYVEIVRVLLKWAKQKHVLSKMIFTTTEKQRTPLILACSGGFAEVVGIILETAKSLGTEEMMLRMLDVDANLHNSLHVAIESGSLTTVELVIKIWQSKEISTKETIDEYIDLPQNEGNTPLHIAAELGILEILKYLVESNAKTDLKNNLQATPLCTAAFRGHAQCVQYLLDVGFDPNLTNIFSLTPLLVACGNGQVEIIRSLLKHKSVLTDRVDFNGRNCLVLAVLSGNIEAIKALVDLHPSFYDLIHEGDRFGDTALHVAAAKSNLEALLLLFSFTTHKNIPNDKEQTPLLIAASEGHTEVVRAIVSSDQLLLTDYDEHSRTALHSAASRGQTHTISALIEMGADVFVLDRLLWTPLDYCIRGGYIKSAKILLQTVPDLVTNRNRQGETPLHLACAVSNGRMVKLLLQNDADVSARLSDGRNPLDVAIDNDNEDGVMEILHHRDWQKALKNATIPLGTDLVSTPFRRLVEKMPIAADAALTKFMSYNEERIDSPNYKITFNYEFLDDTYEIPRWNKMEPGKVLSEPVSFKQEVQNLSYEHELNASNNDLMKAASRDVEQITWLENKEDIYGEDGILKSDTKSYSKETNVMAKNHVLNIMVESKRERLLRHPTVISLLNHKWKKYGQILYAVNLLSYLIFMAVFNVYLTTTPPRFAVNLTGTQKGIDGGRSCVLINVDSQDIWGSECQRGSDFRYVTIALILAFSAIQLAKETLQIFHLKLKYFLLVSKYLELVLYLSAILVVIDADPFGSKTGIRLKWQWEVGAFSILLSWINLLLYVRRTLWLGIYVFMVATVGKSFIKFSVVFLMFLFGFSFSFYVLLSNQRAFYTPITACVKTFVMMIGEMDYTTIFLSRYTSLNYHDRVEYLEATYFIFVVFVVVMSLLLTNLLVGLAVDDISSVQDQAGLQRLALQVDGMLDTEYVAPFFIRRHWVTRERTVFPNKFAKRNFLSRWLFQEESMSLKYIQRTLNPPKTETEQLKDELDRINKMLCGIKTKLRTES